MTDGISIRKPDDFHVHLRRGDMLRLVTPMTAAHFGRALAMPNTDPPILTPQDVGGYRDEIRKASSVFCSTCGASSESHLDPRNFVNHAPTSAAAFEPLMAAKLTQRTRPEDIAPLKEAGVVAMKAYPVGATTNSDGGVSDFRAMGDVFAAMEEADMVLSLHGEDPAGPSLKREDMFEETWDWIVCGYRRLRVVLEHVTTYNMVEVLMGRAYGSARVAATITAHHLALTVDDVLGNPHNFCRPVAKFEQDRDAIVRAAVSGNPRFFFGSDSAPHPIQSKHAAKPAAGCFTAPVALALLAGVFEKAGALDRLEDFTSRFGAEFYGLPPNEGKIELVKEEWRVPPSFGGKSIPCAECDGTGGGDGLVNRSCEACSGDGKVRAVDVVPFMAGQKMSWKVR